MAEIGYDCATPVSVSAAASYGYTFAIRYLAPLDAKYDWKRFKLSEKDALWARNLGVLLVWESYATRANEGFQAGVADARDAAAQATALGYPPDVPLFFACDTNTTADQARPYFAGVASVRPCCGAYGGIRVVDPLLADGTVRWTWQTCAWSVDPITRQALVSQTAHLYQRLHPTTHLQGSFDEDVLLRALPLWLPSAPQPAPVPVPPVTQRLGGTGMFIFQVTDGPAKDTEVYDYGFGPVHISGPESAELTAAGVKVVPISGATYSARFAGVQ